MAPLLDLLLVVRLVHNRQHLLLLVDARVAALGGRVVLLMKLLHCDGVVCGSNEPNRAVRINEQRELKRGSRMLPILQTRTHLRIPGAYRQTEKTDRRTGRHTRQRRQKDRQTYKTEKTERQADRQSHTNRRKSNLIHSHVLPSARLRATSSGRSNRTTTSIPLLGAGAFRTEKARISLTEGTRAQLFVVWGIARHIAVASSYCILYESSLWCSALAQLGCSVK